MNDWLKWIQDLKNASVTKMSSKWGFVLFLFQQLLLNLHYDDRHAWYLTGNNGSKWILFFLWTGIVVIIVIPGNGHHFYSRYDKRASFGLGHYPSDRLVSPHRTQNLWFLTCFALLHIMAPISYPTHFSPILAILFFRFCCIKQGIWPKTGKLPTSTPEIPWKGDVAWLPASVAQWNSRKDGAAKKKEVRASALENWSTALRGLSAAYNTYACWARG